MNSDKHLKRLPFEMTGYEANEFLGEGSFARVYLLKSLSDGSLSVIKIFKDKPSNREFQFRYKRECKSLSSLNHDGIPRVINWGITQDYPWLLMEYAPGITLTEFVRTSFSGATLRNRESFDDYEDKVQRILGSLSQTLVYAHSKGFIHRDLKPDNILVLPDCSTKIIDFGMVRSELGNTVETATGTIVGTPVFIDPLVLFGKKNTSPHSDLYSIGVITCYLLTGQYPYSNENMAILVDSLRTGSMKTPEEMNPLISPWLNSLVLTMINPDQDKRMVSTAKELLDAIHTRKVFPCDRDSFHDAAQQSREKTKSPPKTAGNSSKTWETHSELATKVLRKSLSRGVSQTERQQEKNGFSSLSSAPGAKNKRVVPAILATIGISVVLSVYGLRTVKVNEPKKFSIEDLIEKRDFRTLGRIALKNDEFVKSSTSAIHPHLAGMIFAVRELTQSSPLQAIKLYSEILKSEFSDNTIESELFTLALKSYAANPLETENIFKKTIAREFLESPATNLCNSLYGQFLDALPVQEKLILLLRAYCTAIQNNHWENENPETIIVRGMKLLSQTEKFIQTTFGQSIQSQSFVDPSLNHYLTVNSGRALYGHLWDMNVGKMISQNGNNTEPAIKREKFTTVLPVITGTFAILNSILVESFIHGKHYHPVKYNKKAFPPEKRAQLNGVQLPPSVLISASHQNRYFESLAKDTASLASFWIRERPENEHKAPYFPINFLPKEFLYSLHYSALNQGFTHMFIAALRAWNKYYHKTDNIKGEIQRQILRMATIKAMDFDKWPQRTTSSENSPCTSEIVSFVKVIETECNTIDISDGGTLVPPRLSWCIYSAKALIDSKRPDDSLLALAPVLADIHHWPGLVPHFIPLLTSSLNHASDLFSINCKNILSGLLQQMKNPDIVPETKALFSIAYLSMISRRSKKFRGFSKTYDNTVGNSAADIVRAEALDKHLSFCEKLSHEELRAFLWAAFIDIQDEKQNYCKTVFNIFLAKAENFYARASSFSAGEYSDNLLALWIGASSCLNMSRFTLRNSVYHELANPSFFREMVTRITPLASNRTEMDTLSKAEVDIQFMFLQLLTRCIYRDQSSSMPVEGPGAQLTLASFADAVYRRILPVLSPRRLSSAAGEIERYFSLQHHEKSNEFTINHMAYYLKHRDCFYRRIDQNYVIYTTSTRLFNKVAATEKTKEHQASYAQGFGSQRIHIKKHALLAKANLLDLLNEQNEDLHIEKFLIVRSAARAAITNDNIDGAVSILNRYKSDEIPMEERAQHLSVLARGYYYLYRIALLTSKSRADTYLKLLRSTVAEHDLCSSRQWDFSFIVEHALKGNEIASVQLDINK